MAHLQFCGSMVALVTPMHQDGSIDYPALERLVDWHVVAGTSGIVSVGTTGESATLDPQEEHMAVIARTVKCVAGRVPVIAGTGSNSTAEAIALSQDAKNVGADATLQVVPYYNKPTQRGLLAHFTAIADAVDLPHLLYDVPGRVVTELLPETTIKLAEHPRIVGLKDAKSDISHVPRLRQECGDAFALLSGEDHSALEFMQAGGSGVISVTANLYPKEMAEWCTLMLQGEIVQAKELQQRLLPVHKMLFVEPNPIPIKWALSELGVIERGIRLPLQPLSSHLHNQVRAILPQKLQQ